MSSGLSGLNKTPNGVVMGLAQLALPDPRTRERQMAALLRAGHGMDIARRILASPPGHIPDPE